jgi:hypothetical protein
MLAARLSTARAKPDANNQPEKHNHQVKIPQTSALDKEHWFSAVKLARQLNPSINTEEGKLRCRLEQVEGEIELLSDEKIALNEAIARCGVARSGAVPSKP